MANKVMCDEEKPSKKRLTGKNTSSRIKPVSEKGNSPSITDLVSAHYGAVKSSKTISTPKMGDSRKPSILRNKMKKVVPKKISKDQNLDWFESDKVFGFTG